MIASAVQPELERQLLCLLPLRYRRKKKMGSRTTEARESIALPFTSGVSQKKKVSPPQLFEKSRKSNLMKKKKDQDNTIVHLARAQRRLHKRKIMLRKRFAHPKKLLKVPGFSKCTDELPELVQAFFLSQMSEKIKSIESIH